jgi:hypothetical protein
VTCGQQLQVMAGRLPVTISVMDAKTTTPAATGEVKKRFCSTGSHWTSGEFRKIGTTRWICLACFKRRQAELRNLKKNQLLAAGGSAKK